MVDATCDRGKVDDVRLLLDDGTAVLLDAKLDADSDPMALGA